MLRAAGDSDSPRWSCQDAEGGGREDLELWFLVLGGYENGSYLTLHYQLQVLLDQTTTFFRVSSWMSVAIFWVIKSFVSNFQVDFL